MGRVLRTPESNLSVFSVDRDPREEMHSSSKILEASVPL